MARLLSLVPEGAGIAILAMTYLVVAIGRLPGFRLDRAGAALVLDLVTRLRRNPVPYLLAIAMASNIGSTATITGNPQNMIIGSLSHIPYGTFVAALSPIAGIGLVLTVGLIALVYRSEFRTRQRFRGEPGPAHARSEERRVGKEGGCRWWPRGGRE